MQQKMEEAQASLSEEVLEVTGGGGAVSIKISGMGEFKDIKLDADFLKEDPEFVSEAILQAIVTHRSKQRRKMTMPRVDLQAACKCPVCSDFK